MPRSGTRSSGSQTGYVVFAHLERLAAQGELIYQDDTSVRILSLIEENHQASACEAIGLARSEPHGSTPRRWSSRWVSG